MAAGVSHHHFRWLNLLMRHLGISSGDSTGVDRPDTENQREGGQAEQATAGRDQSGPYAQAGDSSQEVSHQAAEPNVDREDVAGAVSEDGRQEDTGRDQSGPYEPAGAMEGTGQAAKRAETGDGGQARRKPMRCKKVRLIMNPRAGQNFTKITDVLALFSAAGWKTDLAVKLHGWHATELAAEAVEDGYDLIIAYGGDGTINQVVNGIMAAKSKRQSGIVGVLPGGTANQWVSETGEPIDPVKAALSLIGSDVGIVDIGHIQVQELKFPNANQQDNAGPRLIAAKKQRKAQKKKAKQPAGVENYFLLTAGLGIDASVISHTSKTMKQHVGRLAFDIAASEVLSEKHSFPIEIASIEADGSTVLWSGEAFQVILGNTRRYADVVEITPDAYIDDGKLDLCVITEGKTLTTLEQILSFLVRHRPDSHSARNFQGAHFLITVPASIHLQLDGSSVELEDYLSKAESEALQQAPDRAQVMVSYRIDAVPHALRVALPETYDNTLFEHSSFAGETHSAGDKRADKSALGTINRPLQEQQDEQQGAIDRPLQEQQDEQQEQVQHESAEPVNTPLEKEYKVMVSGVVRVPGKRQRYVIAGHVVKEETGETRPVAIRIDEDATVLLHNGEPIPHADVLKLQNGAKVIVVGKKNKRGALKAKQVVL